MAPIPVQAGDAEILASILAYCHDALTGGPVPKFGSAEWCELDDGDPTKHAAVVRAALAHWGTSLAQVEAHVQASHAVSAGHNWAKQSMRPTHEQLVRWRAEVPNQRKGSD